MPLEIKELQIRVVVNEQQAKDAANAAPGSQESKEIGRASCRERV